MSGTIDRFPTMSEDLVGPARKAAAVVTSNSPQPQVCKRLYVGGTGNVVVQLAGDAAPVTYSAVPAGTYLHVRAAYVLPATTATAIVAEY